MKAVVSTALWFALALTAYLTYKEVVLILFSPVLSFLSEKVETSVYGQDPPPFFIKQLPVDIYRSMVLSLRNLISMLTYMGLACLLLLIPVFGSFLFSLIVWIVQGYYAGLSLMDYTLERKRYTIEESIRFARNHRALAIGVGMGFMLILFIPLIGWFAAPGYGSVAATVVTLQKVNANSRNR